MQQLHPKAFWIFFLHFLFTIGLLGLFLSFSSIWPFISATQSELGKGPITLPWGWIILGIIFWIIFCYIWAKLTYRFWRYQLAEDALKVEKGIIWKKYISIPYERIQNVDIYRGVLARIFGLSDLQIQTAGYSGGYGRYGKGESEGKLPGIDMQLAEQLREELVKKAKGAKSGI